MTPISGFCDLIQEHPRISDFSRCSLSHTLLWSAGGVRTTSLAASDVLLREAAGQTISEESVSVVRTACWRQQPGHRGWAGQQKVSADRCRTGGKLQRMRRAAASTEKHQRAFVALKVNKLHTACSLTLQTEGGCARQQLVLMVAAICPNCCQTRLTTRYLAPSPLSADHRDRILASASRHIVNTIMTGRAVCCCAVLALLVSSGGGVSAPHHQRQCGSAFQRNLIACYACFSLSVPLSWP